MCHLMSFYVATALSSHEKKNILYVYYSNRLNARLMLLAQVLGALKTEQSLGLNTSL